MPKVSLSKNWVLDFGLEPGESGQNHQNFLPILTYLGYTVWKGVIFAEGSSILFRTIWVEPSFTKIVGAILETIRHQYENVPSIPENLYKRAEEELGSMK